MELCQKAVFPLRPSLAMDLTCAFVCLGLKGELGTRPTVAAFGLPPQPRSPRLRRSLRWRPCIVTSTTKVKRRVTVGHSVRGFFLLFVFIALKMQPNRGQSFYIFIFYMFIFLLSLIAKQCLCCWISNRNSDVYYVYEFFHLQYVTSWG